MSATKTEIFGTFIGCLDGRIQHLTADYARARFGVTELDSICEPAVVSILSGKRYFHNQPVGLRDWLRFKAIELSSGKHNSRYALVVGHADCKGHGDDIEVHLGDIARAVHEVLSWKCFDQVVGLYAAPDASGVWSLTQVKGDAIRKMTASAA